MASRERVRPPEVAPHLVLLLAWQALRASPATAGINTLLIAVSVLSVATAAAAFDGLRRVVGDMAGESATWDAQVDLARCPQCSALRKRSPLLRMLTVEQRMTTVQQIHSPVGRRQSATIMCVNDGAVLREVNWRSRALRTAWYDGSGEPVVVIGSGVRLADARHVQPALASWVHTDRGSWMVAGRLRERAILSDRAAENHAVLVPDRAPFARLCSRGRVAWRISVDDSASLSRTIDLVSSELRTLSRLRPEEPSTWAITRTDRLARLAGRLARRFSRWVMIVPIMVALLCGAAVFSVQALDAETRVVEFGVRRAVGATRAALRAQLVAEVVLVIAAGAAMACAALLLFGASTTAALHGVAMALLVVAPLAALGMCAPVLEASRSHSVAALEGRAG